MNRRALRVLVGALSCLLGAHGAAAAGLQVSPVTLTLHPEQQADGIWVSNSGSNALQAQVRVYAWTQDTGEDRLLPTQSLVVSPPMLRLGPGERQLVRAVRAGPPPAGRIEQALRLVIDEVPAIAPEEGRRDGLRFLLRYSLPIFLAPSEGAAPAQLIWSLSFIGGQPVLEVSNTGGSHAQIADVGHTPLSGRRIALHPGLLGYALPGATMRWALKPPTFRPDGAGAWDATVDGWTARQTVQIGSPSP